jgi:hypothetical protein
MSLKNPVTLPGIDPGAVRLVATTTLPQAPAVAQMVKKTPETVHYCVHKSPQCIHIMSQLNPNYTLPSHTVNTYFNIILKITLEFLQVVSFLQGSLPDVWRKGTKSCGHCV